MRLAITRLRRVLLAFKDLGHLQRLEIVANLTGHLALLQLFWLRSRLSFGVAEAIDDADDLLAVDFCATTTTVPTFHYHLFCWNYIEHFEINTLFLTCLRVK